MRAGGESWGSTLHHGGPTREETQQTWGEMGLTGLNCKELKAKWEGGMLGGVGRRSGGAEETGVRTGSVRIGGPAHGPCSPAPHLGPPVPDGSLQAPAPCPAELLCQPHRPSARAPLETGPEPGASRPTGLPALPPPLPLECPPCPGALCSRGLGAVLPGDQQTLPGEGSRPRG